MESENPRLDRYILGQAHHPEPVVCFLPTASGDDASYIARFHAAFSALPCRPRHLSLLREPGKAEERLSGCDIIYVGGGNTRNMLALWREWRLDVLLRQAWEKGVILCGLSAGAICWFEHGLTDSAGPLAPMPCLGFLPGSCAPHYDGEIARRPAFHSAIGQGTLPSGHALDDGATLHFIGENVAHRVSSVPRPALIRCDGKRAV